MTGYHAVSVLADALAKGADLPRDAVLRAMVLCQHSARKPGGILHMNEYPESSDMQINGCLSRRQDLNPEPDAYKAPALPVEL